MNRIFFLLVTFAVWVLPNSGLLARDNAKIVFISGKPSHGPGAHEHRAGNLILAKALNESGLPVDAVVLDEVGYPAEAKALEGAATIVVFCTGHRNHLLNPKLGEFDALMKKGTGVVMIHWATEAQIGMPAKMFLQWMGGYCGLNWSVNPHWKPNFTAFPDHPVSRGLTPFALDDEWYYHMRFVPELKGVTPILSAVPGPETLKRPDGDRSGNPAVRKAVAAGESQHVAWCYDRPDGKGRGFGFTGAHNHSSWQDDNFRRVVLNAIAWTAHVEVPEQGVPSKTPTDKEMKANWDDKPSKKPAASKPKSPAVEIPDLNTARESFSSSIDQAKGLELLVSTLESSNDPVVQRALLDGILLGLDGQRDVRPPPKWVALKKRIDESGDRELQQRALQLSQIFGDRSATRKALATLKNKQAKPEDRRVALRSLLTQQNGDLPGALKSLLDDDDLRVEAIRAYGSYESAEGAKLLLARYKDFPTEAQRAVVETLATRKRYAEAVFQALERGDLERQAVPAYVTRNLSRLLGQKFHSKYGVKKLDESKAEQIALYRKMARPPALDSASAAKGRVIYQRACMACHVLYGEGGKIGPELTGSNRADLDYLLLNIVDPSGDIADAYKLVTVETTNGQVLAGSLGDENDTRIVLRTIGQEITILKSDIKKREVSPVSMMPEGLLQTLTQPEILDLFKYMQTKEQVALPQ